jgi:hypothetical protein
MVRPRRAQPGRLRRRRAGNPLVDEVFRLEDGLGRIVAALRARGVPILADTPLPHINPAEQGSDYRDFNAKADRRPVGRLYAEEIERFGYTF